MWALGRRVLDWHHLFPLTLVGLAKWTPVLGEQKGKTVALLCKLTAASHGGSLKELTFVGPKNCVQEPVSRTHLVQNLPEKPTLEQESLGLETVISSLHDMGFTDAHINELFSIQPDANHKQLLDIVSEFILLGINPEPVCVALKRCPQLLKLPKAQMKKRSSYLRKLGLGEGKLKKVLYVCPEIFTMRHRDIDSVVQVLKEKCLFTVQQVTKILCRCPSVLRESPNELEYKFQPGEKRKTCLAGLAVRGPPPPLHEGPWGQSISCPGPLPFTPRDTWRWED
ncbi:transcription termination factor 4, mitochondrial isoform X2 [Perognathus longimembris pacificus]|uniref:transcription termination factor 4, mitochondrial isoform X2 n=1 Tax=Perognathus longimembris pacificus TaxID=214514 RepID=UPI002018CB8D|nr:transcription termination factor 4, mitochondrial isoform X2 [Perognathus longimembris pacificus]